MIYALQVFVGDLVRVSGPKKPRKGPDAEVEKTREIHMKLRKAITLRRSVRFERSFFSNWVEFRDLRVASSRRGLGQGFGT